MEPEEDEISLVVESGHLSTDKLWVLWEKSCKQSADAVAQACAEVVQNDFRKMFCGIFASPLQRGDIRELRPLRLHCALTTAPTEERKLSLDENICTRLDLFP